MVIIDITYAFKIKRNNLENRSRRISCIAKLPANVRQRKLFGSAETSLGRNRNNGNIQPARDYKGINKDFIM